MGSIANAAAFIKANMPFGLGEAIKTLDGHPTRDFDALGIDPAIVLRE
jgi:hypothetical protein